MSESTDPVTREREQILGVYARRDAGTGDLYAPWRPDEFFMRTGRRRVAVRLPRNANVRRVDRRELKVLFPELSAEVLSVTLAPPLARSIVQRSWVAATLLEALPPLRTHLLGVMVKNK